MSGLDALDVIPRRAVPNPQLLAHLMNRDLLPIEVRDTPLDAERNRSPGDALALSASPRHARLDPLANQGALKLGERGFCRKVRFLGQNPKIGYQKFNDLQSAKISKKQLCDRTGR